MVYQETNTYHMRLVTKQNMHKKKLVGLDGLVLVYNVMRVISHAV